MHLKAKDAPSLGRLGASLFIILQTSHRLTITAKPIIAHYRLHRPHCFLVVLNDDTAI